jgi:hypothetical protein
MYNNKYKLNSSLNKIGGYEEELYKQKYLKYKQKYLKLKAQQGGDPETEEELLLRLDFTNRKLIADEIYRTNFSKTRSVEDLQLYENEKILLEQIISNQERILLILKNVEKYILEKEEERVTYSSELPELENKISLKLKDIERKRTIYEEKKKVAFNKFQEELANQIQIIFERIKELDRKKIAKELFDLQDITEKKYKLLFVLKNDEIPLLNINIETNKFNIDRIKKVCENLAEQHKKLKARA